MKKLIIAISIAVASLMAADYSQMTIEELNALRGIVPIEERAAFRAEMQNRLQAMTPEERQTYMKNRENAQGKGLKDGSGAGRMNKGNEYQSQGIKQRLRNGSGAGSMKKGTNRGPK